MNPSVDRPRRELSPLLVTAWLASDLAGHEPPMLDSLLERVLAHHCPEAVPSHLVDRALPAPPVGVIPIPLVRRSLGGWRIGCCSNPIVGLVHDDRHDHVARRISTENASLLDPESRTVVSTTNSWTKSYRLPLRVRAVACVRWFALGNRARLHDALRRVWFLGKKRSIGYGHVARWTVERAAADYSWFAPAPSSPAVVLMRTLPAGHWLPAMLTGYRRDFCGVAPPYWHPERACEAVRPA